MRLLVPLLEFNLEQVSKTISDEQRPAGVIISKGKLWRFFANLRKDLNIREEHISPEERRPKND